MGNGKWEMGDGKWEMSEIFYLDGFIKSRIAKAKEQRTKKQTTNNNQPIRVNLTIYRGLPKKNVLIIFIFVFLIHEKESRLNKGGMILLNL